MTRIWYQKWQSRRLNKQLRQQQQLLKNDKQEFDWRPVTTYEPSFPLYILEPSTLEVEFCFLREHLISKGEISPFDKHYWKRYVMRWHEEGLNVRVEYSFCIPIDMVKKIHPPYIEMDHSLFDYDMKFKVDNLYWNFSKDFNWLESTLVQGCYQRLKRHGLVHDFLGMLRTYEIHVIPDQSKRHGIVYMRLKQASPAQKG